MQSIETVAAGLHEQRRAVRDEDAVQEAFLRLVLVVPAARVTNPGGYWYRTARRVQIDQRRHAAAARRTERRWAESEALLKPEPLDLDRIERLRRAVSYLPTGRRRLAELELAGVTDLGELAEKLRLSRGATKVLRHRTYRQLRRLVEASPD